MAGDAQPNLSPMWQELAALPTGPPQRTAPRAPEPPTPEYEDAAVQRAMELGIEGLGRQRRNVLAPR
jgi:hypothetical protein